MFGSPFNYTCGGGGGGGGDYADGGEAGGAARTLGNTDNYSLGFLTNNVIRLFIANNGKIGFGTSTPYNPFELLNATEPQFRLTHTDNVDYTTFGVNADGDFTITTISGTSEGDISLMPASSKVGINSATPGSSLDILCKNSTDIGLQIEAASSQTANLFEINSNGGSGGDYLEIDCNGNIAKLKTDPWLNSDTNLFLGYEVCGAGNLNHSTGNTGYSNTSIGYQSLYSSTFGNSNISIGSQSLYSSTWGNSNISIGSQSLYSSTFGNSNISIGSQSLYSSTFGNSNISIGSQSLYSMTDGGENISIGSQSLYSLPWGNNNISIGYQSLYSSTFGDNNISIGSQSLYSMTDGGENISIGSQSLSFATEGYYNICIGYQSSRFITTGNYNISIGYEAGYGVQHQSYSNNVLLGYQAGNSLSTGSSNIIIGYGADATSATASNELNIGGTLFGDLSNKYIGINDASPDFPLEILHTTTPQFCISHTDGVDYATFGVDGDGALTITTVDGGGANGNINLVPDGITTIGDGGTTNYVEIKTDGEINFHGTARTYNAIWIDSGGIKAPGAKPATFILHGINGAWSFADATEANQETVSANMQIPHRMDRSVAPTFIIGWSADGISPGICEWELTYLWTSEDEDTTAAAQETLTSTDSGVASSTSNGLVLTTISGIDVPSATDACLHFKIKRLSAGANDTIADTVELLGVCLQFVSNKFGTAI